MEQRDRLRARSRWYMRGPSTARAGFGCLLLLAARPAPAAAELLKGVSYGPVPLKGLGESIPVDDFMAEAAKPLWGRRGRGDLAIIKGLGANVIRMYGNDPNLTHGEFLDEAESTGLKVIAGQSDYPFTQMAGNCLQTGFDCFEQVRASYLQNLRNGFLRPDRTYHPALLHVIVINEPDLKLPGIDEPRTFCKAVASAIDGMLDAERAVGVTGPLINFTVTFSFAICKACQWPKGDPMKPALGQMLELRRALLEPEAYGYSPQNDLPTFYNTRFLNSLNTANPSNEIRPLFLDRYEASFSTVPVFLEEYHHPYVDQFADISNMLKIAQASSLLLGISFFEYQVRYDKGGEETFFGMFGLGDYKIATMDFGNGQELGVWCLTPIKDRKTTANVPSEIAKAYGGKDLDFADLCLPDPAKVPLTAAGFNVVKLQGRVSRTAVFLTRLVEHMGGEVLDAAALVGLAQAAPSFDTAVATLEEEPSWVRWDPNAACVADRLASTGSVGHAVEYACLHTYFNCKYIPEECKGNSWDTADYVLSVYYMTNLATDKPKPLKDCYFDGAARFVRPALYSAGATQCVVTRDPQTTALTDEGFQAILRQRDPSKTAIFITRVAAGKLGASIGDRGQLWNFAQQPPLSMYDLVHLLRGAQWVCGGETGRSCSGFWSTFWELTAPTNGIWWQKWALLGIISLVLLGICGSALWVSFPRQCRPDRWERLRDWHCCAEAGDTTTSSSDSESG